MYYGIRFIVTPDERIKNVEVIRNIFPILGDVKEFVEKQGDTIEVSREILLSTKTEKTQEEAEASAKEWYGKFREERLLRVLEG